MGEVGLCGHGVQTRNVTCVADGGLLVNMSNCAPDPSVVVTKVCVMVTCFCGVLQFHLWLHNK